MTMLPSLKSALAVGALALAATASPVYKLNETTPTVFPMPSFVTMTRQLTVVVETSLVDCAHGSLPTLPPAVAFDRGLTAVTSTRYYCGGLAAPQMGVLEERGEDAVPDVDEEDVEERDEDEDEDEDDEEDEDDDEDDEDDDDDDDDDDDGDNLDDDSEPGYFVEHFKRQNSDCTSRRMLGPSLDFGGTSTVYTTTSTVSQLVNCGRCTAVKTVPFFSPGYKPVPLPTYTTTVTAIQASRTTLFKCKPHPTQYHVLSKRSVVFTHLTRVDHWPPALTTYTDFPKGRDEVGCAYYYNLLPSRLGSVRKIYSATRTSTAHKDCGDCALVWATAAYPYSVGPLPTTKTKKGKTTVTAMACRTP
ncbi:uncharacterized protein Triagg1_7859 [Trichoderma aggressivum f. europaeum]|uniref:Uncharacterized protein n=1 Tax=Trichoderma aggressivum f. europaeum TaxID=173218 RepID=A0AAE1I955_9HYPO|nr:hypothetical protein Triagg1_7859 [Trichoderma aggressivum f. europaeum]